jgi:hypothetical protein
MQMAITAPQISMGLLAVGPDAEVLTVAALSKTTLGSV